MTGWPALPGEIQDASTRSDISRGAPAVVLRHRAGRFPRRKIRAGADGETARRDQRPEFPARQQGAFRRGVQRHRGGPGPRARQAARRSRRVRCLRHRGKAGGCGEIRRVGRSLPRQRARARERNRLQRGVSGDRGGLPRSGGLADPHNRGRGPGRRARRRQREERLRPVPHAQPAARQTLPRADRRCFLRTVRRRQARCPRRAQAPPRDGRGKAPRLTRARRAFLGGAAIDRNSAGTPLRREVPSRIRRGRQGFRIRRQGDGKTRGARRFRSAEGAGFIESRLARAIFRAMMPSPAARSELAPTGKLRVGINYGNFLLVSRDPASGGYRGIAVDLGRELGRRLDVPVDLVAFETAGKLADAVKAGVWDVAFLGNEPQRAGEIAFSPAYLEIEAGYLVPASSPIRTMAEVDQEGVRIAVAAKSAYDLYLSRNLKHARLVRAQGID